MKQFQFLLNVYVTYIYSYIKSLCVGFIFTGKALLCGSHQSNDWTSEEKLGKENLA